MPQLVDSMANVQQSSRKLEKMSHPKTPTPNVTPAQKTRTNVTLPLHGSKTKTGAGPQGRSSAAEKPGSRPCREHSFLTDVADVRQMEKGLLQLLDDFHSGKLQAFGQDCSFEKMDHVREQQERLARLHFELDGQQEMRGFDSAESREAANKNLGKLMENLHELCTSIIYRRGIIQQATIRLSFENLSCRQTMN